MRAPSAPLEVLCLASHALPGVVVIVWFSYSELAQFLRADRAEEASH